MGNRCRTMVGERAGAGKGILSKDEGKFNR